MIQGQIPPTPLADMLERLARDGKAYGGGSMPSKPSAVYAKFGKTAAAKRLKLMERDGLVRFTGRGKHRKIWLTEFGYKKATS